MPVVHVKPSAIRIYCIKQYCGIKRIGETRQDDRFFSTHASYRLRRPEYAKKPSSRPYEIKKGRPIPSLKGSRSADIVTRTNDVNFYFVNCGRPKIFLASAGDAIGL
jgi:hypothetical protein